MSDSCLSIRSYREADESQVSRLWRRVFPDDPPHNAPELVIARKLGTQRDLFLVGEERARVVATALGGYDGHRGWVYHMAVAPECQRTGIGRAIMLDLERRLLALGCPKLNLQVRSQNREVVSFYNSLGYEVEERVSMGKKLSPS